ncbi:MAG TPA: universal stress protein [Jatrophihabitans sp.]|nr:universal stress protein [Jatrophihabitans sp.]
MIGSGRRVVLGISGHRTAHLVEWAAVLVRSGDTVRIVHGYRPIPYASTDWQLPVDDDSLIRKVTERHVQAAAAQLRRRRPDITVSSELTSNPAGRVLAEAARGADLVMVGAPHCDRSRLVLARLLAEVDCPVVVFGAAEPLLVGPVTALLRGSQVDDSILRAAFALAHQRGCGLLALKPWQPPLDGSASYAETTEQKALDGYLAGIGELFPDVAVAAELRFGKPLRVLVGHSALDLLVLGLPRPDAQPEYFNALLDAVLPGHGYPIMLIPEAGSANRWLASDPRPDRAYQVAVEPLGGSR